MLKKIKQVPVFLAIAIMVACVLAGIALGNQKALDRAADSAEMIFGEVVQIYAQRTEKAKNLLVLCNRSIADATQTQALANAIGMTREAARPGQVAAANSSLTSAVAAVLPLLEDAATAEDMKLAIGVLDDLGSLDKQLDRRAKAYNEAVSAAKDVYNTLPMRFLLGGMPEVYQ